MSRRKFDHDEARRRFATGEPIAVIARNLGASWTGVQRVVVPGVAERMAKTRDRWQAEHRQPCIDGCGNTVTYQGARFYGGRCKRCASLALATTVRETELRCVRCKEWKPDHEFPHNRGGKVSRRGRHEVCRPCSTILRREYRDRNKVPCVRGCGRLVLAPTENPTGKCKSCARKEVNARRRTRDAA